MTKLKPCHYLSALALGARYLTVRTHWIGTSSVQLIEAWVPQGADYDIYALIDDPKTCAWKFLDSKERLAEAKESPWEKRTKDDFWHRRTDETVDLPKGLSAKTALFYIQKMLPNGDWVISRDPIDRKGWEISSPTCQACFGYSGETFYFQGTFYADGIPSLIDALTQFYKSLISYQFEAFS